MRALILAGGSGTRFWPSSRGERPKQLLPLADDGASLLRATVDRLEGVVEAEQIWVCTTRDLAAATARELPELAADRILAEPCGRNTAAAIGWAARRIGGDEPLVVLPADHRVGDARAFGEALRRAGEAASRGAIVTLGVRPRWPETGYGYLEVADQGSESGVARVIRFTEKPDLETARRFVDSGRYLWNAGIFVFRPAALGAALATHLPGLERSLTEILDHPGRLDELWAALPSISIDHGVMERLDDLAVVPIDCGWSDLGSWDALLEVLPHDAAGNASRGDALLLGGSRGSLAWAENGVTVALVGVEDLVVVATGDAVLVVPRSRCQDVREVAAALAARAARGVGT